MQNVDARLRCDQIQMLSAIYANAHADAEFPGSRSCPEASQLLWGDLAMILGP